jgi:hypothetical protein
MSLTFLTPRALAASLRLTLLSPGTISRTNSFLLVLETRFLVILWRSMPVAVEASAVWTVSFFEINLCQTPCSLR